MSILNWPEQFSPVQCYFDLMEMSAVYTDARTGASLRQRRSAPIWIAQFVFEEIQPCHWPKLQSFLNQLKGSINSVRVWDFSDPGTLDNVEGTMFSDGTVFSDDFGFGGESGFFVAQAAAIGATEIVVFAGEVTDLDDGRKIGLPNDRLYQASGEVAVVGDTLTIPIAPPLREAIVAGDFASTYRPTARLFRVGGDPIQRGLDRFGNITLTFTEEVNP